MIRLNTRGRAVKDAAQEAELFRRRAIAGFLIIAASLMVLLGRYAYLQVGRHEEFTTRSEQNRIRLRPLAPSRGLLYDRNGKLLAENVPQYRLEITPQHVGNVESALKRLGEVVALSDEDLERFREQYQPRRPFVGIPLRLQLSEEEVARFAVERYRFPGVEVVPYLTRHYPYGEAFAHVLGYVGRVDAADRERMDPERHGWVTQIGKSGIERRYESDLIGSAGYEEVEADVSGRALRVLRRVAPVPGRHLYLSLDADLQTAAIQAFGGQPGSAVAIDPRNGEVLAFVSMPSFDPNLFVNGISRRDYTALLNGKDQPLFNRALSGAFAPGSTVKPFVALAGLEAGIREPDDTVFSTGDFHLDGTNQVYRDWKKGGHGRVDLTNALAESVNTYFYKLAVDLGIERLSSALAGYGFGRATGIDLSGEALGVLPSREWKLATRAKAWYQGETVLAGIGQGYWVVTPLQLSHAMATLANGGVPHQPHLLIATQDGYNAVRTAAAAIAPGSTLITDPSHFEAVRRGMVAVVNAPNGTARRIAVGAPYVIAGKSGTAQRYSRDAREEYDEANVPEALQHRALFVCFAPAEAPRIAVAVVVDRGISGSRSAAPIARQILDAWLNRPVP